MGKKERANRVPALRLREIFVLCRGFSLCGGVVGDVHDVTTRRKWGKNG